MAIQTHTTYTATDRPAEANYREYVVGTRRGSVRVTHGRVAGGPAGWTALGIGQRAWTTVYATRAAAVAAMFAGVTWIDLEAAARNRAAAAA